MTTCVLSTGSPAHTTEFAPWSEGLDPRSPKAVQNVQFILVDVDCSKMIVLAEFVLERRLGPFDVRSCPEVLVFAKTRRAQLCLTDVAGRTSDIVN